MGAYGRGRGAWEVVRERRGVVANVGETCVKHKGMVTCFVW